MPDISKSQSPSKSTIAALKGGPDFHIWFRRFQEWTRLPAALLLDASLVEFARAKGFEEPPPR